MKLVQMLTGKFLLKEIAIDFLGEFPESEALTAILVVTDQSTEVQDYIPAKTT